MASYIFPAFRTVVDTGISTITSLLSPNSFNLTGTWTYEFREPDPESPEQKRTDTEKVRIRQIGNFLWGVGETERFKRKFKYRLSLKHNVVSGTYKKDARKGVTSGSGVVQLVVNCDRNKMKGSTAWMDTDSSKTEADEVTWRLIT